MNAPSLRRLLLIRCGAGVGILLCILSVAIYLIVRRSMFQELDNSIKQTAALLANQVELENGGITFEWQEGLGTNRSLIADGLFQFWDEKTGATTRSPALGEQNLPRFSGDGGKPLLRDITLSDGGHGRAIGLRIHPFVVPEEMARMKARGHVINPQTIPYLLVVADDADPVLRTLERLQWILATGTILTLGMGFLVIDRVIHTSLKPINQLTSQVQDRAEHQLDSALNLPHTLPSELTSLARNFDILLARVAAIRERERDFIRHAAHELRTPIAGLRATTDLALSKIRTADEYREHLATCQNTAGELGELITRLTALARIGRPGDTQKSTVFDLAGQFSRCVASFVPLFEAKGIGLSCHLPTDEIRTLGDPSLSRIIFNNLLDNALSYTSGTVRIHLTKTQGHAELRISNPTDLPVENPDQWFEPLFRRDPSRHDAGSHLGIGLTLSLNAANAMGWSLTAHTTDAGWIEFLLRAPNASV
ncbi:HAMP domain-containing protein [Luteolibacter yonseiensis]|uniref:histidine kinase n=1 Tax=Luteolibacter yonseiensis TaxID=1144680 RepID=A0A934VAZ2_9BACT|nr:histidine kinase dimerization/phospho-acceptor domain-containing protein [Luteolibacter yonseiensis]MBK1816713.1 HAMP domain-containing protein [Luteolibacter yonseiensis]